MFIYPIWLHDKEEEETNLKPFYAKRVTKGKIEEISVFGLTDKTVLYLDLDDIHQIREMTLKKLKENWEFSKWK